MVEEQVPSFPIYVTLPVWGVVLLFVLVRVWYLRESCATFLLLATWFRYSIATFHQYTYPPVVLGLSVIALTSIVVVAVTRSTSDSQSLVVHLAEPGVG